MSATYFNLSVGITSPLRTASSAMRREFMEDAAVALRKVYSGQATTGCSITVLDGGANASGVATFSAAATANDTVTIAGQAFTAKASGAGNNEFNIGATATTTASALADAINNSTTSTFKGMVYAVASAGVCTVYAACPGNLGNLVTMTKSCSVCTLTGLSGGKLSGGSSNATQYWAY